MSEEYRQSIEAWRNFLGADKVFREQELWKTRVLHGKHDRVAYCSMAKRMMIKRILIAAMREGSVACMGPGLWRFPA